MDTRANTLTVPLAAALVVGLLTSLQSRINGSLAEVIGGALQAATVSFIIGMCLLSFVLVMSSRLRRGAATLFRELSSGRLRWWQVTGGLLGAYFVLAQGLAVPAIGVGLFSISTIAGLTVSSLLVDKIGLGPAGRQQITGVRLLAAGLSIVAVAVAVSSRLTEQTLSVSLTLLGFSAGVGAAIQPALNGRVSSATGQPIVAGWFNFVLGSASLTCILVIMVSTGSAQVPAFDQVPALLYTGGFVGIVFISLAAWTVGRIGVLRLSLLSIAGQLTGALTLDLVFTSFVDFSLVAGVALAFAAAALANLRARSSRPIVPLRTASIEEEGH